MELEKIKKGRLIQTHISRIFLTEKCVYKIKKPVDFGFLDFTTLAKRKFYCQRELKLNRRLCPDLYLKVLPVTEKGKTIDWAIMMRRLPQEKIMNELLKKNKVGNTNLKKLAEILASFHQKSRTDKNYGGVKEIKFNWDENFKQMKKFIGKTISKNDFYFVKKAINEFMTRNKNLFQKRMREGKVKWCHGDLHSGNIFIVKDKIYIFDCIEFNKRFACIDIIKDIAFLAMDLDFYKKPGGSKFLVKSYLEYTKDWETFKVLDFYKCYLAFTRGKINSFENLFGTAKKYFNLAVDYAKNL